MSIPERLTTTVSTRGRGHPSQGDSPSAAIGSGNAAGGGDHPGGRGVEASGCIRRVPVRGRSWLPYFPSCAQDTGRDRGASVRRHRAPQRTRLIGTCKSPALEKRTRSLRFCSLERLFVLRKSWIFCSCNWRAAEDAGALCAVPLADAAPRSLPAAGHRALLPADRDLHRLPRPMLRTPAVRSHGEGLYTEGNASLVNLVRGSRRPSFLSANGR